MGQARNRGTYEERQAQAIIRNEVERIEREARRAEEQRLDEIREAKRRAKMTLEQRTKERRAKSMLGMILGAQIGMAVAAGTGTIEEDPTP